MINHNSLPPEIIFLQRINLITFIMCESLIVCFTSLLLFTLGQNLFLISFFHLGSAVYILVIHRYYTQIVDTSSTNVFPKHKQGVGVCLLALSTPSKVPPEAFLIVVQNPEAIKG